MSKEEIARKLVQEAAAKVRKQDDEIAEWYRRKGEEQVEARGLIAEHRKVCRVLYGCRECRALQRKLDAANMGD
jgi:hypothetical protein